MAVQDCESCVARSLRRLLTDLPIGASLYDLERPQPEQTGGLFPCLEFFLPDVLGEVHHEWKDESFDGFLPLFARKVGEWEAELFGASIIISNQSWNPFHLKIQIAPVEDEVTWLELRVGDSLHSTRKPSSISKSYDRVYAFQDNPEQMDWAYEVTFGERQF